MEVDFDIDALLLERAELIAEKHRLREELSRAAVRDGEAKGVVEFARRCFDTPISRRRIDNEYATEARKAMADFLATPSPLSDAAQEVLEAAVELTEAVRELLNPTDQAPAEDRVHRHRSAHDRLRDAVDRYLALLEGRDREEG